MPGPLPPLQRVPTLERLLVPGEEIIYTGKLHPFYGWQLALVAAAFLILSYLYPAALIGTALFSILYLVPLQKNEMAVTNKRLLLRLGRFKLLTETIASDQLLNWRIAQSAVENIFHAGTLQITFTELGVTRQIVLTHLWHPITFVEALETLQPALRGNTRHAA